MLFEVQAGGHIPGSSGYFDNKLHFKWAISLPSYHQPMSISSTIDATACTQ